MVIAFLICCFAFMAMLLLFPADVLLASQNALNLWLNNVLPSLLPFFVTASLLFKSGAAQRTGRFFAPLLKRINLPGSAAPVLILGAVSGYPVGARLTGELLRDGSVSLQGGEQLLITSNLAGPMFMMGTVASGMLKNSALGVPLLLTHYAAALLSAFVFSLVYRNKPSAIAPTKAATIQPFSLVEAFTDSVNEGMLAMLRIGGLLIFFSALIAVLRCSGILRFFSDALELFFTMVKLPAAFAEPLLSGSLEMTLGCKAVSNLSASLAEKAAACAFLLSFGGGSVIFQTLSFAKVRVGRYAFFKCIQGLLSSALCYLWVSQLSLPTFSAASAVQEKTSGLIVLTSMSVAFIFMGYSLLLMRRSHQRKHLPLPPPRRPHRDDL